MARIDLHDKPFDDGTIVKLELFEDYAQAWLPTFIMKGYHEICVFDFFAGTGYDKTNTPGSPIRILTKIKQFSKDIKEKNVKVNLFFNEFDKEKYVSLCKACNCFLENNYDLKSSIIINYSNSDFDDLFYKLLPTIRKMPSLVFLDQNGFKFISDKYFLEISKLYQTDFLYFLSSSYFWRFGDTPEFKVNLDIDMEEARKQGYKFIHRSIIDQLRKRIPLDSNLKLYPFSIKKGSNIHGIIFGAKHPLAVDKFLSVSWKKNATNGEANFDIDDDYSKEQIDLFEGLKLSKIDGFKKKLNEKILNKEIKNNYEAYTFVLEEGHIPAHAAEEIKKMKKDCLIDFNSSSPCVTYDNVYKFRKKIDYSIISEKGIKK